jgi:hypothetical protein
MINDLTKDKVKDFLVSNTFEYKATQNKLSFPILLRIYKKLKIGVKFSEIKIGDKLVIDGHHRYLASILADVEIATLPSHRTTATKILEWCDIEIDNEDWDKDEKEIKRFNEIDAKNSNLSLDELIKLLK